MSLFGRQRRDPVQGEPLLPQRFPMRGTAGYNVTTQSALTIPAVWACVRLRADLISSLPLNAYRKVGKGPALDIDLPPVLVSPSGNGVTLSEWLYMSQVSLDLRGNAYGQIVDRDNLGRPKQIELANPDTVSCQFDRKTGQRIYRFNGKSVDAYDVWHERAYSFPGSPVGLSPIQYAAVAMGVAIAAEQFGADWFSDGAHPSSMLTNENVKTLNDLQAKTVKDRFLAAIGTSREPVVLANGWKYTQLSISPNESQFIETMKFGVSQIARMFGMPPEMVGGATDGSAVTYANVEQRGIDFLTYGFNATIVRRENALSGLLAWGAKQYVKFNTREFLRSDTMTRAKANQVALQNRYMLVDEIRAGEDLPPLTEEQKAELAAQFVFSSPAAVTADTGTDVADHTHDSTGVTS